jgi:hypothetical protein
VGVRRAAVTIRGETRSYGVTSDSGFSTIRYFCATCGSLVFGGPGNESGMMSVYAGTLDDTAQFKPTAAVCTRSRPAWDHIRGDFREFAALPSAGAEQPQ